MLVGSDGGSAGKQGLLLKPRAAVTVQIQLRCSANLLKLFSGK